MQEIESLPFDTMPALPYRPRAACWLILIGTVLVFVGFALPTIIVFFPYVEQTELRRSIWQRFFHYHPARTPLSRKAYARME